MLIKKQIITEHKQSMIDITTDVEEAVIESNVRNGICVVYTPHTTAAITINENSNHEVVRDILFGLNKAYPDMQEFRNHDGNSASHIKSSIFGASETFIISNGKLILGFWQAIYFCEFYGPKTRNYYIKIIEG